MLQLEVEVARRAVLEGSGRSSVEPDVSLLPQLLKQAEAPETLSLSMPNIRSINEIVPYL